MSVVKNNMSIVNKLKHRLDSTKRIFEIVDSHIAIERISICNSCEHLTGLRRCRMCGCFVDAKTKLADSNCPIKKW
jgi:hypothetical protein